jgi:sulfite reductase (ferredoxin)
MTPPTATADLGADLTREPFPVDVDPATLTPQDLPADSYGDLAEIEDFEALVAGYRAGTVTEDDFKPKRLAFGCYGIRQSDTHMLRVKAPLGRFSARAFEAMAVIAERWTPLGIGHVTTRQNFQFHRVELDDVADAMRVVALAGLTTREACGNTIRNVTMSPMAGIDPDEVLDTQAAADEVVRALLRHPAYQALPRKFKIAFSATTADDAGTAFHDLGVLPAISDDGEHGYRIVLGGGLGSAPREAVALEPFTPAEWLLPTAIAVLDVFERDGERRNRVRARMKFLVKKLGEEEFVRRVLEQREQVLANGVRSTVVPHPAIAEGEGVDAPRQLPGHLAGRDGDAYRAWLDANVLRQRRADRFAVFASLYLGDLTVAQFRGLAGLMRELDLDDARLTIRQNLVFRDVDADKLPDLWAGLSQLDLDRALAEKAGDVVSCPGAETCNLAITASRGLGAAVTDELAARGLDTLPGVSTNISGCPNSCGQHQAWDLGFSGMAKRDDQGNEAPAYRIWLGGHVGDGGAKFAEYVANVPARNAPVAAARILEHFEADRRGDEKLHAWYERVGKAGIKEIVDDLRAVPSKEQDPSYYRDWGDEDPFEVILGQGECMT